jgi:UDP-3-O-[3-hydroxymyristoyl] glucosamine N-acyltransferase
VIHPTAWISDTARLGRNVSVGAFTYVGDDVIIEDEVTIGAHCTIYERAKIGQNTTVHSGCSIREDVIIGKRCVIQNNSVVGGDGFGYARQADGTWFKIFQAGTVVIEDDAELGACTTIDRAALGETRIQSGVKIDNLAHIGHGSSVGSDSLICAQVGLSGSTTVGKQVILAGQVGAAGHLTIGDGAIATAQAGIPNSVEPGQIIAGSPAMDKRLWLKTSALIARLPELQKTLRDLERRVRELEKTLNTEPEVFKEGV